MSRRPGGLLLGTVFLAAAAVACPNTGTGNPDAGGDGGACSLASCVGADVSSCPDGGNYLCTQGCCQLGGCGSLADCGQQPCALSPLGCVCSSTGQCLVKPCSVDADCAGAAATPVCKGGVCRAADTAAARCSVLPPLIVAHAGVPVSLVLQAFDGAGQVVRLGSPPTWTVSDGLGRVDAQGRFMDSQASSAPGDVVIQAALGGASCSAHATVYAMPTHPRLTLIDANTLLPVTTALVSATSPVDGGALGPAAPAPDALGSYDLSGLDLSPGNLLNAFDAQHQYVSLVLPEALGALADLVFPLAQVAPFVADAGAAALGGFGGDFAEGTGPFARDAGGAGGLLFGLAGTALTGSPADLSLTALLGPSTQVGLPTGEGILAPVGTELSLDGTRLSCRYEGLGSAGGCGLAVLDAGADPFSCGNRPAWGLGGPIPVADIAGLLLGGSAPTLGEILAAAAPAFSGFASAVALNDPYVLAPPERASQVPNSCNPSKFTLAASPLPNPTALSPVQLNLDAPVSLLVNLILPPLPLLGTTCSSSALVLAGALLPGVGLLPLGLSSGSVVNASGVPSPQCLTYDPDNPSQADGALAVHLAAAHGGLEGARYGVLTLSALNAGPQTVSGLLQTFAALPYGSSATFGGQSFLGFAATAGYTAVGRAFAPGDGGLSAGSATVLRLRFSDSDALGNGTGAQWVISYAPTANPFVLPIPPLAFADRTRRSSGSAGALAAVQALQLQPSDGPTALVDFSKGALALDLLDRVTAFSSLDLSNP